MRIVVGVTGASGAPYALAMLRLLAETPHEVHLVLSEYGAKVLEYECAVSINELRGLVHATHSNDNLAAPIASGSFRCDAMIVVPCSMRSLAAIANGLADNLICRAADVMMKERKNLVLAVRETPVNAIHLENMLKLSRLGVGVVPLSPGFYHKPETMDELVAMMAGRLLDSLGVENSAFSRWQGM